MCHGAPRSFPSIAGTRSARRARARACHTYEPNKLWLHNPLAVELRHHKAANKLVVAVHRPAVTVSIDAVVLMSTAFRRAPFVVLGGKTPEPAGQFESMRRQVINHRALYVYVVAGLFSRHSACVHRRFLLFESRTDDGGLRRVTFGISIQLRRHGLHFSSSGTTLRSSMYCSSVATSLSSFSGISASTRSFHRGRE